MKESEQQNETAYGWNLWDYGKAMIITAASIATTYAGWQLLSRMWSEAPVAELDLQLESDAINNTFLVESVMTSAAQTNIPSVSTLPSRNPTSRKLLSTNATIINPVPDIQFEATIEDRYALNGTHIFSGDVDAISVLSPGNSFLPGWLGFDCQIGSYDTSSLTYGLFVVNGSIAYMGDGTSGLQILDISNPANPVLLGNYANASASSGVFVKGNIAYLAGGNDGLYILNVSNPANPTLLGNYNTPGSAVRVFVQNGIAYVPDANSGLQLIDISNPTSPFLLGSYNTPSIATAISVQNTIVYVADNFSGLQVLDVSNPTSPTFIGSYNTPDRANNVFVEGNVAYVADGTSGLIVLDVSNPASPTFLGSYDTPDSARGIFVQNRIAYVADYSSGLLVLDVNNPANIKLLGNYVTEGFALDVVVDNDLVYLVDYTDGLRILDLSRGDITGAATPALVGQRFLLEAISYDAQWQSLANDSFWLTVNQLPKRQDNSLANQKVFPGSTLKIDLDSDALFIDPDNAYLTLSVTVDGGSLPNWLGFTLKPTPIGSYITPDSAYDVYVQGKTAYVADGFSGLQIVDVSNPANPTFLGSYNTPGFAYGIIIQNTTAYVADDTSGLQILDVSNPASPSFVGSYNTPNQAWGVSIQNNIAYVADRDSGLQVLDVTNPLSPILLGTYNTPGSAYAVFVKDTTAYVADQNSGLQVLDVSNPAVPTFLGSYSTPAQALDVFVQGSTAYVAVWNSGFKILDVSNPANIVLLGSYQIPVVAIGVLVQDNMAFVGDDGSLQIIDVSNTSIPTLLSSYSIGIQGGIYGIFVQENTAYLTDRTYGLHIVDITQWEFSAKPTTADVGNYVIQLTATDELGGTASDTFILRVEGPPVFNATLLNQQINVGDTYNYFIQQGIVTDPNNDPIAFDAKLVGGGSLPSWLGFNAFSATFAGTPDTAGVYPIEVRATDNIAGSTSTSFTLDVKFKPQVKTPLVDPVPWREGKTFSYTIPNNAFEDLNGNSLVYSASLENNLALPSWLNFDVNTRTFSGTPPLNAAASLVVVVFATDAVTGASTSQNFVLIVKPNLAPEVANPISAQSAQVNQAFSYVVPESTFRDPNNDALNYTAGGLPKWLRFFATTHTFSGKPDRGDTDTYANRVHSIQVIATDGERSASTTFPLSVEGASRWELFIKIGSPIVAFLGLLVAAYAARSVMLNRCHRHRYQKFGQTVNVGTYGEFIALDCDAERVHRMQAKLLKSSSPKGRNKCVGIFRSSRRVNPNGNLPSWLVYHPGSNELEVIAPGPSEHDEAEWVIQAKDKAGVLLIKFTLRVEGACEQMHSLFDDEVDDHGIALQAV